MQQDKDNAAEAYYTMAESAQAKGVSYHTVSRAVRRGKLTVTRLGRQALIASADLDAWQPVLKKRPSQYRHRTPDTKVIPTFVGEVRS